MSVKHKGIWLLIIATVIIWIAILYLRIELDLKLADIFRGMYRGFVGTFGAISAFDINPTWGDVAALVVAGGIVLWTLSAGSKPAQIAGALVALLVLFIHSETRQAIMRDNAWYSKLVNEGYPAFASPPASNRSPRNSQPVSLTPQCGSSLPPGAICLKPGDRYPRTFQASRKHTIVLCTPEGYKKRYGVEWSDGEGYILRWDVLVRHSWNSRIWQPYAIMDYTGRWNDPVWANADGYRIGQPDGVCEWFTPRAKDLDMYDIVVSNVYRG